MFREHNINIADGPGLDAFGRLRVSDIYTQFDITQIQDQRDDLLAVKEDNAGTRTYNTGESSSTLDVTTAGDKVVLQSRRYGFYEAGKSLFVKITGVLLDAAGNFSSRIGYFDDDNDKTVDSGGNGFFFYHSNGAIGVGRRSFVTGAQVDTEILQAGWNKDTMDGTGPSGITLDFTMAQIFIIDCQWLGVGRVRMGVVIDGITYYVHEFNHANMSTTAYSQHLNLPVRWEIESLGGAGSITAICGSVESEGGVHPVGKLASAHTGYNAGQTVNNLNDETLIAVRMKDAYTRTSININDIAIMGDSNNPVIINVYLCDSVTGGTWTDTDSGVSEIQTGNGITYNGRLIATQYSSANNRMGSKNFLNTIFTGADVEGNQEIIVVEGYAPIGNCITFAGINYQEVR